jgi:predicted metal-dependent phosphoesterase TrpH
MTAITSLEAALARIAALEAAAKATPSKISLKVGEKGTVCLQHGARYPIALYASQWERLIPWLRNGGIDRIETFIADNSALIAERGGARED